MQKDPPWSGRRVIVVAAHLGDETIGAGATLSLASEVIFVHLTDGAPREMREAQAKSFSSRAEYTAARRKEFLAAMQAGMIVPVAAVDLGYPEQEAPFHLAEITHGLLRLAIRSRFEVVLVHPYDGRNSDHDAAAFAAQGALHLLTDRYRPQRVEYLACHGCNGRWEAGIFLPNRGLPEMVYRLDPEQRARKDRMLACFAPQEEMLGPFQGHEERFRTAPEYDFARPPHPGELPYEQSARVVPNSRWVALAEKAEEELGLR